MRRNRYSDSFWNDARALRASGMGLRELARLCRIPAGTVLARAKRHDWRAWAESEGKDDPDVRRARAMTEAVEAGRLVAAASGILCEADTSLLLTRRFVRLSAAMLRESEAYFAWAGRTFGFET